MLVANYGGGSVAVLPLGPDGSLKPSSSSIQHTGSSVNPARQKEPHAHSVNLDSADKFAYVADLGLDKVMIYRFDATKGMLVANDPAFAAASSRRRSASLRHSPATSGSPTSLTSSRTRSRPSPETPSAAG